MSSEEIEPKVREWLISERIEMQDQQDDRALMHTLIRYPVGKNGHMFAIIIPKGRDLVAISSMTRVDAGQQDLMRKMAKTELDEWKSWMHECRMQLMASGVDWAVHVGHDDNRTTGPLQAFNVSEPIWFDGLTKNELMQTLRRLWLAKLGMIHEIKYTFGKGTGAPGPVDDWNEKKSRSKKTNKPQKAAEQEVHIDDSMSFGNGFDPDDWV
ncbi:MAG: DUF2299 family protein [Candidatus Poseidoniaceae archaeon]|jgi:hypothetical protein|nr:DUF2299 family protein [Candidatus Poseidoniaceae archaeon]